MSACLHKQHAVQAVCTGHGHAHGRVLPVPVGTRSGSQAEGEFPRV